ncbi:hypothetical protein PsorP6_016652 [Peronosclerospora sorghi]|uniref:Uncharacterized protein n=1 Tax=Peronosclerospora sorghi TaxID=230839 RepID=A0ACC0VND7_9STRA|nr:hypothetical protein PsorP6_016652 [Peronosclerospora sorghi]
MAITTTEQQLKFQPPLDEVIAQGETSFYDLIVQTLEPALGHELPQLEIRCQDLSVSAEIPSRIDTASELPSIYNSLKQFARKLTRSSHSTKRYVLKSINAVFEPGTITLVLGQPGSGKTTLMKVLSGQLPLEKTITIEGAISYNERTWTELLHKLPQFAAYVPQIDMHFPALSVQETLEFAHKCCMDDVASQLRKDLLSHGTPEQIDMALRTVHALDKQYPDLILTQLGLHMCRNTMIGNAMARGVSGGERRRVTIGEMEFGMKCATFMDEVSTGLDSATTFDIVRTQRAIAKTMHKTVVMALLQPGPEVFDLFDNLLLLQDGEVMYHGPRDQVLAYFETLGFLCPPERDVADYLLDLGTEQQHQYERPTSCSIHPLPRSASEFADHFRHSHLYDQITQKLEMPWSAQHRRDAEQHLDFMATFRQSFWKGTLTVIHRQMLLALRNTAFLRVRALMVVIIGLVYGSTFRSVDPTNAQMTLGVLYQTTMFLARGQASQTPVFVAAREIYYKQRRANFYRTSSFAIASLIALVPAAAAESFVFGCFVYWMCGFVAEVKYFVFFVLCMFLTNLALCGWFFALTAIAPNFNIAKPCSTFTNALYVIFAGYVIPKNQLPSFLVWIYWINPLAWCLRAVAVSQYRSPKFDVCVFAGEDYCARYNMTMGEYSLSLYDIPSNKVWIGAGIVYLLFALALLVVIGSYILEYKRYDGPAASLACVGKQQKKSQVDYTSDEQRKCGSETDSYIMAGTVRAASERLPRESKSSCGLATVDFHDEQAKFVPVTLAFKNLWYSVPSSGTHRGSVALLKDISGYALPGTITALMGSSGAGKTTLMDVIAGRKTGGSIRGDILLNGYHATKLALRRCTGYCEQQDVHSEGVTIREALTFSAFLRQDSSVSIRAKVASVEECLELLDLRAIADEIIRGRSQEQLKRLTIGVELTAQPSVLFLDEPTSGLNAHSAKVIMDGVRNVANSGRTIVCTIHQPSSDIFYLFDSVLLLKRGGEMVFFGELNNPPPDDRACGHLIDYFEAIPGIPRLLAGQNPASWMLECIGAGVAGDKSMTHSTVPVNFVQRFCESKEKEALVAALEQAGMSTPAPDCSELAFKSKRAASQSMQLHMLIARFLTIYWRTPSYNLTRLVVAFGLGLVFGLTVVNTTFTTYQGLNSAVGLIFMTATYQGYITYVGCLPFTLQERAPFYRERDAQTYNALWYLVAATIVEVPYSFLSGLIFTSVFFPFLGVGSFGTAVLYWINVSLFVLTQTYMGQLLIYALPSVEVAAIVGVLINAIFLLFAGFNPPADAIPDGYKWLYYLTPQRYSLSILVALLFGHCPQDPTYDAGTQTFLNVRAELACQPLQNTPPSLGHMTVKKYIAQVFHMQYDDMWSNFGCVFLFLGGFRILALVALRYVNYQKR